jgi:CubicO group peptidase (beta-lactamase class C family)
MLQKDFAGIPIKSFLLVCSFFLRKQVAFSLAFSLNCFSINVHAEDMTDLHSLARHRILCQSLSTDQQWKATTKLEAPTRQNYWRGPLLSDVDGDDNFWQVQDPALTNLNLKALHEYGELCQRTHADAYLIVYKGKIVAEGYAKSYMVPIMTMSSVKSITALLTGMLVEDGKIASIDDPVGKYLPQWNNGARAKVTIRHLLTMTSGLKRRSGEQGADASVGYVSDKDAHVMALPLTYEPGKQWEYSNEGVQLLSPILDKAAGMPIQEYARIRLFEPIGMKHTSLRVDEKKHAWTYADAKTTLRDFARIGMLMMNAGQWAGNQIVSASWVHDCVQPCPQNHDYGYLWWLTSAPEGFGTRGYRNTDIYCFPERNLVIARMQNTPSDESPTYLNDALALFAKMVVPMEH